jgi:hypothetical protein
MTRILTLVATLAFATFNTFTHAAGPMPKGQAPGWYRMLVGDFEVTALSDGKGYRWLPANDTANNGSKQAARGMRYRR